MTLAYDDGISAIDGLLESPAAAWIAPTRDRLNRTRGALLAALAGLPISSRFCSWLGLSGRKYVFSVYPALECPALCDAVLLAVIRDMAGQRRVISMRETGAFPELVIAKAQDELLTFGAGVELHLYLLGASSSERAAAVADLEIAQA
jgi:hypothetical protein